MSIWTDNERRENVKMKIVCWWDSVNKRKVNIKLIKRFGAKVTTLTFRLTLKIASSSNTRSTRNWKTERVFNAFMRTWKTDNLEAKE